MSKLISCSRDFPDECKGCPDYVEEIEGVGELHALTALFGFQSGPSYVIKKCKRFNWKSYDRT
jgi:hypothetical protein